MGWLIRHRSAEQVDRLRAALALLRRRLSRSPGIGEQLERRGTISLRMTSIGAGLPYLVWYHYDEADPKGPVWLMMLRHEKQAREAFGDWALD